MSSPKVTFPSNTRAEDTNLPVSSEFTVPDILHEYAKFFTAYSSTFLQADVETASHIQLKIAHTWRVVSTAQKIMATEPLLQSQETEKILLVAALFHDIARFEQFAKFKTFSDSHSFNHGLQGVRILHKAKILQQEQKTVRQAILQAVMLHNAFKIPKKKFGAACYPLLALRDADKLDILKIMQAHLAAGSKADSAVVLHLEDNPQKYTPGILQALEKGKVALYSDMRFHNDFRILLCTWAGDLFFPTSKNILVGERLLDPIVEGLSSIPDIKEKVVNTLRRTLGLMHAK